MLAGTLAIKVALSRMPCPVGAALVPPLSVILQPVTPEVTKLAKIALTVAAGRALDAKK